MKFNGKVCFEVESDLLEDGKKSPIYPLIKQLHKALCKIAKESYPVYMHDLMNDIKGSFFIKPGKGENYTTRNGKLVSSQDFHKLPIQ